MLPHEMSTALNGNGDGHGTHSLIRQLEKKAAKTRAAVSPHAIKESRVTFRTSEGVELNGAPVRVARHLVVFELYNPIVPLRFSEDIEEFNLLLHSQTVYSVHAIVTN